MGFLLFFLGCKKREVSKTIEVYYRNEIQGIGGGGIELLIPIPVQQSSLCVCAHCACRLFVTPCLVLQQSHVTVNTGRRNTVLLPPIHEFGNCISVEESSLQGLALQVIEETGRAEA